MKELIDLWKHAPLWRFCMIGSVTCLVAMFLFPPKFQRSFSSSSNQAAMANSTVSPQVSSTVPTALPPPSATYVAGQRTVPPAVQFDANGNPLVPGAAVMQLTSSISIDGVGITNGTNDSSFGQMR